MVDVLTFCKEILGVTLTEAQEHVLKDMVQQASPEDGKSSTATRGRQLARVHMPGIFAKGNEHYLRAYIMGKGSGNSFLIKVAALYRVHCLLNMVTIPQEYFNIMSGDQIEVVILVGGEDPCSTVDRYASDLEHMIFGTKDFPRPIKQPTKVSSNGKVTSTKFVFASEKDNESLKSGNVVLRVLLERSVMGIKGANICSLFMDDCWTSKKIPDIMAMALPVINVFRTKEDNRVWGNVVATGSNLGESSKLRTLEVSLHNFNIFVMDSEHMVPEVPGWGITGINPS
jgi:hypothetical protein